MLKSGLTLYFIRHGETDWNAAKRYQGQTDIPLNDRGRGQARRNGRALRERIADPAAFGFISSPLSRTRETMELLRVEMGLEIGGYTLDDRLKEINFGHWEGELWDELPRTDPVNFAARKAAAWTWEPRGGESYQMLSNRVAGWLAELEGDAIVVSHGGVSRVIRGMVLGLAPERIPHLEVPQDRVLCLRLGQQEWL